MTKRDKTKERALFAGVSAGGHEEFKHLTQQKLHKCRKIEGVENMFVTAY